MLLSAVGSVYRDYCVLLRRQIRVSACGPQLLQLPGKVRVLVAEERLLLGPCSSLFDTRFGKCPERRREKLLRWSIDTILMDEQSFFGWLISRISFRGTCFG